MTSPAYGRLANTVDTLVPKRHLANKEQESVRDALLRDAYSPEKARLDALLLDALKHAPRGAPRATGPGWKDAHAWNGQKGPRPLSMRS